MFKLSNIEKNMLSQQYLHRVYREVNGYRNLSEVSDIAQTYGEILPDSIDKLLSQLTLTHQDVFFDLGSGIGKVTAQFFLNSIIKEACGIEIIPELHQKAVSASQIIHKELPDFYLGERKLTYVEGDFLEISLATATIVMICAPCFSQKSLSALGCIIENTPAIHTVLSLRPLSTLLRLPFKKAVRIECSWDTALCYIYSTALHSGT